MVFGASESKEVTGEKFIKDLIKDAGVNAEVKFVTRIGNQTKKSRPIKERREMVGHAFIEASQR